MEGLQSYAEVKKCKDTRTSVKCERTDAMKTNTVA
jgi:hypothetical protein